MTELSVTSTGFTAENRSWLWGPHGTEPGTTPGITLDAALFEAATHFPNGYLPSGTVISPEGGPYSGTGAVGGILFSSVRFATATVKVGGALLVHGFIRSSKLPFQTGTGSLGAGGAAALPLVHIST